MGDKLRKRIREDPFTRIDNGIFHDQRLSLKARGLLCTALSLPDGWSFSVRGLAALCKDRRTSIEGALDELEALGYLRRDRDQARQQSGQFGGLDYVFSDKPMEAGADVDFQQRTDVDFQQRTDVDFQQRTDVDFQQRTDADFQQRTDVDFPHAENQQLETKEQEIYIPPYIPPRRRGPHVIASAESESSLHSVAPPSRIESGFDSQNGGAAKKSRARKTKSTPDYEPEMFDRFWKAYPRHEDRQSAVAEWDRLRPDPALMRTMGRALERAKASEDWQRGIGIPYAVRWLRRRRWEDEPMSPARKAETADRQAGGAYIPEVSDTW